MRSCRSSSLDGVNGFIKRRREEQEEGRKTVAENEEEGAAAGSHCSMPSAMGKCRRKDHHMPTSWCGMSQLLERWQKHHLLKLSSLWCCYIAAENEMMAVGSSHCTVDLHCCQKDSLLVPVSSFSSGPLSPACVVVPSEDAPGYLSCAQAVSSGTQALWLISHF